MDDEPARLIQMPSSLRGKVLIAMPSIEDPHFERSLVFMCLHNEQGALGLVLNRRAWHITFPDLLKELSITSRPGIDIPIHFGGPVETSRGFVLYSRDYAPTTTSLNVNEDVGLAATLDILQAIARGEGPRNAMLALGYADWGPGQLEHEIQSNGWLHCDADTELLFQEDPSKKYERALAKIGVDAESLSDNVGNA